MAYVKISKVISVMREDDIRFFTVTDTDKSKLIELKTGDHSVEHAVDKLEDFLSDLSGTWVNVNLRKKETKATGAGGDNKTGNYDFKVALNGWSSESGSSSSKSSDNNLVMSLMRELSDQKIENMRLQMQMMQKSEMDVLNKKLEALSEGSPLDKYLPVLMPMFQKISGMPMANAAPGIHGVEEEESKATAKDKLKSAINRLAKADKQLIANLTKLADLAEQKPEVYKMAIAQLNSF